MCGGRVVAALDPHDSVGILDQHDLRTKVFHEEEELAAFLVNADESERVRYLTVCAPNHVHDRHCRLGLAHGADVVCEKPVVIDPAALDGLAEEEARTGRRIWTVLQLRHHDRIERLARDLAAHHGGPRMKVVLTYVTTRGRWYDTSWKGDVARSGGLATNIGVHLFDLLLWLFGPCDHQELHLASARRMAGHLELERATVQWFLSVDEADLPADATGRTYRSLAIDGSRLEFSAGFEELHSRVYERILFGRGLGLSDARPSIELAARLRSLAVTPPARTELHPHLR